MATLYLNYLNSGLESLDSAEFALLDSLAKACPFVAGPGVDIARQFVALFDMGAIYDDVAICNTKSGEYRHGSSLYQQEENFLSKLNKTLKKQSVDKFKVYPNPAYDQVTIGYVEPGDLIITDISGRQVISVKLESGKSLAEINIQHLPPGMFFYHFQVGGRSFQSGKLIVR